LAEPQMLHQGLPLVEQVIAHSAHTGFGPHCRTTYRNQPDDILKPAKEPGIIRASLV
jgi:hypothetical protein